MQQMQLQHKRFSETEVIQLLSEREWCVNTYPGSCPATILNDDMHTRPCTVHT
jgi:hypothetical protein